MDEQDKNTNALMNLKSIVFSYISVQELCEEYHNIFYIRFYGPYRAGRGRVREAEGIGKEGGDSEKMRRTEGAPDNMQQKGHFANLSLILRPCIWVPSIRSRTTGSRDYPASS